MLIKAMVIVFFLLCEVTSCVISLSIIVLCIA
jgi:hypothetical protein